MPVLQWMALVAWLVPGVEAAPSAPDQGAAPVAGKEQPTAASHADTGTLVVVADVAGVKVHLDDVAVGSPPLQLNAVHAGTHTLKLEIPGREPVMRTVDVRPGSSIVLDLLLTAPPLVVSTTTPASSHAAPASPRKQAHGNPAWTVVRNMLSTAPWAGLAVVAAVSTFLVAAILWTVTPEELPLTDRLPDITDPQWQAARWTGLAVAALTGGLALAVLLWPAMPFANLLNTVVDGSEEPPS